jgi:hypothetical protein
VALDLRPSLGPALEAFGVPVTLTPLDLTAPVVTTGIWSSPLPEPQPYGSDFLKRDPRKVLSIPRSAIAEVPRGLAIAAAEYDGGDVLSWKADGFDRTVETDCWRVLVVRVA